MNLKQCEVCGQLMSHDTQGSKHPDCERREYGYKDEDTLRELYHGKMMGMPEIADEFNVSTSTIKNWMDKFGIERRSKSEREQLSWEKKPWHDKDTLERLYWKEDLQQSEIADKLGCGETTITYWMDKHGIDTVRGRPLFYTGERGYEVIQYETEETVRRFKVHRLAAYAWGKLSSDELFNPLIDVHHETGIQWDNRESKLTVMRRSDHMRHHAKERFSKPN